VSRATRRSLGAALSGVLALATVAIAVAPSAHATEVYPLPAGGTITVRGHGLGHGHGMSQYGARGAAIAGHSAGYIVDFFYPGTALATEPSTLRIRVDLPTAGGNTCVQAGTGMSASGVGALSTTGVGRFRIVPDGSGLAVQKGASTTSCTAGTWTTVKGGLSSQVDFTSAKGYLHLYRSDGTSSDYRGTVGAVRSGSGEITVNRVSLDDYAMGVTPREMPASWQPAAVQAQAIAARSYGEYAREHAASGSLYDICDTDQCQVYGGMTHYDAAGNVLWSDDPAAITGNSNEVAQYHGATAFTQFSASDGGWTVDGGEPYLIAKQDPYDNAGTGDPYLNWTVDVAVSDIAGYFGLAKVTDVGITQRDGNGDWGGRVLAGYVDGVDHSGQSQHITATGFDLQDAMNLPHNWFTLAPAPPGAPASMAAIAGDGYVHVTWDVPGAPGSDPITGYTVTAAGRTQTVSASTRSVVVAGLTNGVAVSVSVRALAGSVTGAAASASATPNAVPEPVTAVNPQRLFDTRSPARTVTRVHNLLVDPVALAGGALPSSGVSAVQLALTVASPPADGTLYVVTDGAPLMPTAAIAYRKGHTTSATVSVRLIGDGLIRFIPSTGAVNLIGDLMGWAGSAAGSTLTSVAPARLAYQHSIPAGSGIAFTARGVAGIPGDATGVVLGVSGGPLTAQGYLRLWPDGVPTPGVSQVQASSDGSGANTVLVPIGSDGKVRIGSSSTALGATVTVLGYLAPAAAGRTALETSQTAGIADPGAGAGTSLTVGSTPVSLHVLGGPGVPHTGVPAMLVAVTVSGAGTVGGIYVYAAGASRPSAYTATFPAGSASTIVTLVQVGAGGAITLATSGPTVTTRVDWLGWLH
jgi:peptidoglycan hydrolase-like amidase